MKLHNQPTFIAPLKTFQDRKGNQYQLRGEQNILSDKGYPITNYYELYKKDCNSKDFVKVGAKEELYVNSCRDGLRLSRIQKERYNPNTGNLLEWTEITKQLDGYDIECKNSFISMNEPIRVMYSTDSFGKPVNKIKFPGNLNIMGFHPRTNMTKRIMKLFAHI